MKNVFVYRGFNWSKVSKNNLKKIKDTGNEIYISYDNTNSFEIPEENVFYYNNYDYFYWGYHLPSTTQIKSRKPERIPENAGYSWYNPEYAFLQTIKKFNIESDYYWNTEDDVFCKNWNKTMELVENNKSDFIGTYLSHKLSEDRFYDFKDEDYKFKVEEKHKYRSFGVLQRYSHQLVQNLIRYYEEYYFHAFYEYSVPTIASMTGLKLDDFNNQGEEIYSFRTLRGQELMADELNKNRDFINKNYLFHPIRSVLL